jgi:DNA-binding NarL/FixJ family response regulator
MSRPVLRVLVTDDQPVIVAGLKMMLDAESDIDVVGPASDGVLAVQRAAELNPDVVLMDVRMPRMDGIEATRRIMAAGTAGAVLMITTFEDEEYLRESTRAGACGFLMKNAGPDLLAAAVRSAARGDALIDPAMTRSLLARTLQVESSGEVARQYQDRLASRSERERDILSAVTRGLSNTEIAHELFITEATVKTHLSNVFTKVGARGRVEAAMFGYESGFVRPHWT